MTMPRPAFVILLATALVVAGPARAAAREDAIVMMGLPAGKQTVAPVGRTGTRAEYSYNDRGRGEHIVATWTLDEAGIPTEYSGQGNDYMKADVRETFRISHGKASWKNRMEQGETAVTGPAFYVPANGPPEFAGVLARALLAAPDHKLALLPAGEARIESAGTVTVSLKDGATAQLTQYRITGLGFTPASVWLDEARDTAGLVSNFFSVVMARYQDSLATMLDTQSKSTEAWSRSLAQEQRHVPAGDLLIRNARLFDPRDLTVAPGMSVLVRGERIARVAPDADMESVAGADVIDAGGRFLMPGLWDNHQHFGESDGTLDLACGITSARDMANDTDQFPARVARFDDGTELGPRVFKAGIIDGTGELAGPTKMRVDTAEQALEDVNWYADHGYGQIKIYSSIKPELVPVIAEAAHARGLRVSGHVPAFMSARQFVEAGADEIQHLNFIVLNFLADTVKETRNMQRFTAVAEHARDFPPDDPRVQEFIAVLERHHTVLDPTMNVFEALFSGDPAAPPPGLEDVVPRFPPQIRRQMTSGALEVPKGQEDAYRDAFPAMLRLLKALYDAGVPIIPGTDALPGYSLIHELELYERAGIAPPEVLRMATLTSAQTIGVDRERGVIAGGRLADMILVDGDPSRRIADLHHVTTVIKGGVVFRPAELERALGILPAGS
jgi:imidazolonepropionase-like amidohydrolase